MAQDADVRLPFRQEKRASPMMVVSRLFLGVFALSLFTGCEREERKVRASPPAARLRTIVQSELHAGPPLQIPETENPYEKNAWAVSEGRRLY
ncbi:MAG: hypothetical protein ACK4UN_21155, partial [Limisphaerales bacterium]